MKRLQDITNAQAPQQDAANQLLQEQQRFQLQMEEQRQFYEQQLHRLSHEAQAHSDEKEGLRSKMKKVYQRTQEGMLDEESKQRYEDLVSQVMAENEAAMKDAEGASMQ